MNPARPRKPTHLSDDALLARLVELNAAHRLSLTALLTHIAEVDVRHLYAKRGHSSMHRYCVRELNMSDDEAYARIRVARLGRRLPTVLTWLADGRLHLTAARLLASHLTPENHRAVLAEASGLNVAGIKQLVARLAPKPDVPTRVRALPAPRSASRPTSGQEATRRSACETPRPPNAPPTLDGSRSPSARPPSPKEPRSQVAPPALDGSRSASAQPPSPEAPRSQVAPPTLDGSRSASARPPSPEALRSQVTPPTLDGSRSPSARPPSPEALRSQVAPSTLDGSRSTSARPPAPEEPRPRVAPPLTLEAPRPIVAPLAPERFEVRFTASAELIEKLTEVTALLSHAVPDGDLPTVLERALDLARTQLVKRRYGAGALAERAGAPGHASAGAEPVTGEGVKGQPKSRAQTAPRSAEARPRATNPAEEPTGRKPAIRRDGEARSRTSSPGEESAPRASASRPATPRDGEALSRASSPAEERTSASRSATPRDGEALSRASSPAEERTSASRSATRRDGETRSRASGPWEEPAEQTSAPPRPCTSTASRRAGGAEQLVSKPAPRHEAPVQRSRYIPAAVRAEVWRRDEGRCTYVDPETGHACGERRFLELHHEQPFARGGEHSVEGLTLHCRAHNAWAARLDFGAEHMAAFARPDEP